MDEYKQMCMCGHKKRLHAEGCGSCIKCDCHEFEIGPCVDWGMLTLEQFVKMLKLMSSDLRNVYHKLDAMRAELDERDDDLERALTRVRELEDNNRDDTIERMWVALNDLGARLPLMPPR